MESSHYKAVFEQSLALLLIIDTNFSIAAASDGFLDVTKSSREQVLGKYVFDVFPKSKPHIQSVLISTMREAIQKVLKTKKTHTSSVVRYDIPNEEDGFDTRYWKAINTPILDEHGEVMYIKQRFEDVTDTEQLTSQLQMEKKNLDEYKTAAEYIQNALKQAPVPICILRGPDHIFELANQKFERLAANRDMLGKTAREALPELEDQGVFEILDHVYESEKTYVGSERPVTLNPGNYGEVQAYMNIVYQVMYDTEGEKNGIFVLGSDVTDLVLARQEAEESEHMYRTLIEESTVATALFVGKDFTVHYANEKMLSYWDKDKSVFGKPFVEILPELVDQSALNNLKQAFDTGNIYTGVEEKTRLLIDEEMQVFYFNYTYTPLYNNKGRIYGIQNIAIDVTERVRAKKALEEREYTLRQILNSMPQKISHTDAEGNVVFFNQQWVLQTGFSLDELKDKGWIKTIHPADLPEIKESWRKAVKHKTSFEVECRIFNKDKGYRWHLNRAEPVRDQSGNMVMWVGSNTDIHEQKIHEELLENAVHERTEALEKSNKKLKEEIKKKEKQKKELIAVNQELESFTYISSHDLQEPLRKIQAFTGRLIDTELDNITGRGKDYFDRIMIAVERMRILIDDLLMFAKVNKAERKFETIDMEKIIDHVKADYKEPLKKKKGTIETMGLCDVTIIVFQFRELLNNLVSNSLKFSRPGVPPCIKIYSKMVKGKDANEKDLYPERLYCKITYKDNGIGFEPAYSDRIFEVFQRLHTRDEYPGTGIGLAIVKKIVENHEGVITVTSKPSEGTRFDIYIPAERTEADD